MLDINIEKIKALPKPYILKLIAQAKAYLKQNKVVQKMFKDYNVDISYLDYIPIGFKDLDVSAQTVRGCIYLNYKLLQTGDFKQALSYMVHEIEHVLDQITGTKPTQNTDKMNSEDYITSPEELNAFNIQIEFMEDEFGKNEADKYVNHLLDYHDIKGKKRKEVKKKLTE
jgi:hypothetical protein